MHFILCQLLIYSHIRDEKREDLFNEYMNISKKLKGVLWTP